MKTIHKYTLTKLQLSNGIVFVEIPEGAKLLTAQVQDGHICLWAIVDPERTKQQRRVFVIGTGWPRFPEFAIEYLGTVQFPESCLVFHVFIESA